MNEKKHCGSSSAVGQSLDKYICSLKMYSQSSYLLFPVSLPNFKIQNVGKQTVRETEKVTCYLRGNTCSKGSFSSQRSPRTLWALHQLAE